MNVALVAMPFMDIHVPSIQLGLLRALGAKHAFDVRTWHAGLDFASAIGAELYDALARQRAPMVGDWLFSPAAFGADAPDRDARMLDDLAVELPRDDLLHARNTVVPSYLDDLAGSPFWAGVRVAGFTCTFQQSVASLALARRLRQRHPGIVTLFGGANLDGEMGLELMRHADQVDYAIVGEADDAFPAFLTALAVGADPAAVPGVASRGPAGVTLTPPAPPRDRLDDLPTPDYTEYFERAEARGIVERTAHRTVALPFESARGCWWGAKHHCTFCGLNGTTMSFRSKSAERVLDELAELCRRHRTFRFDAVDNILDPRYLTTLLPAIAESGADYDLFYEVKANLSREQLALLARAGVRRIQPGLESLHSGVLALMNKGVRASQNINLLRWASHYGIAVSWNILWGFPGETAAQYAEQAALIPHLAHLPPPAGAGRIWLERFSPLFTLAGAPAPSYSYIYPAAVDLGRLAYFFEYDQPGPLPAESYDPVCEAVEAWTKAWSSGTPPRLTSWSAPGFLQIYDGRHPGREGTYTFEGDLARIYQAAGDRALSAGAIRDRLALAMPVAEVEEILDDFAAHGLMVRDGPLALALAVPATRPAPARGSP